MVQYLDCRVLKFPLIKSNNIYIYICVPWHGMQDSGTTLNVFAGAGSSSTTGSIDNRSSCLIAAVSRNCRVFHFLDFFFSSLWLSPNHPGFLAQLEGTEHAPVPIDVMSCLDLPGSAGFGGEGYHSTRRLPLF